MGCSDVEKAVVFVETNLGTNLAVPVPPDITVKDFKGEVELMHLNCFPEIGRISVTALMVKKRSYFYHLSESLTLKTVFMGSKSCWLLQTEVHPNQEQNPNPTQVDNRINSAEHNVVVTDSVVCSLKRKKAKKIKKKVKRKSPMQGHTAELNQSNTLENSVIAAEEYVSKTASESTLSVSGIINKYFSDYDEVASTPPVWVWSRHNNTNNKKESQVKSDVFESKKPQVGKRLLLASESLGISPSKQGSALCLSRYTSNRNSPLRKVLEEW